LVNFASNAVKFTERGGITLIVRKLNESADGIAIRFAVADTGIGVSPEQQSRIFNAFEQGDSSTTKQYGGTGLGLAISQRLAELMGGRVGVDSELGQGSTFWLELTLLKARNDAPAESTPMLADSVAATDESRWDHLANALRRRRSKRVLLVEDNMVNQEVALDLLGEVGLQIDLAENGQQAVERVQKQDYDLVLMDMQMPVLDGIGATRLIRALPGRASLPIIAMTANAFAEDRQRCLAAGMNDHVAKPVSGELLYETLLQWLPPEEDAEVETAPPVTAAPTTEADRLAALAKLTEIDVQSGLNNMMGRVPSYLRLLSHFAEGAQASNERLKKALAGGEAEALRDAAHSVKGTSGALGLLDLHVRAQALEAAVRQKQSTNQVSEMTEDLIAAQTFMAKALQAILIS
jgi:CheY-like chemotaxis protein